jgi:hypothetical protein
MEASLLDEVRSACGWVADQASSVRIDQGSLAAYAASLPVEQIRTAAIDPALHHLGHGDDTVAFFLTLDAINFGSGYFPHLRKRPGLSGYFTVAAALTDHFRAHGPFSAAALARLTAADCAAVFGQDGGDPAVGELMRLFAEALNELGRYLEERFGGSFVALVESAGGKAERLVAVLAGMPFFRDVQPYRGRGVPFYKRAQLTAADLALAFAGDGPGRFDDLDRLTIFADNLVPHVLRVDGVLAYDEGLAARIDRGEPIPPGSPEEVELRAGAVHAVELLKAELRRQGHAVTAMGLDYLLWTRGHAPRYKARPRHRTRTVFY